jgi:hypothetical protein
MYYAPKEHNPPHIHAIYQAAEAVLAIGDGELTAGRLGSRFTEMSYLRIGNFAKMVKSHFR